MADKLATLAQVKEWLNLTDGSADNLLGRLVASASQFILNYLNIDTFANSTYDEVYDGYGQNFMLLRQNPATAITALSFNGVVIPAASGDGKTVPYQSGYVLLQQRLTLFGYQFPRERSSVAVTYTAGFQSTETWNVPATGPYQVIPSYMALETSTASIGGVPLAEVKGVPGPNQYALTDGTFVFNAAQAGATVTLTYGYVPADISQATIELVAERFRYKDRIGYSSKSLGGQETVAFQANDIPKFVLAVLNKYRVVVPV